MTIGSPVVMNIQTADKVVSGLFKWEKQEKEGGMANI